MNKTVPTGQDVAEFLDSLPDESQRRDSLELVRMMREVSGEQPAMWGPSIIGFGQRHLVYESGREVDYLRIGFSPRKGKFALYLTGDASRYADRLADMGKHKVGKACIYINRLADVDAAKLSELIEVAYAHSS